MRVQTTQSKFEDSIKTKLSASIPSYGIEFGASYGTGKQEDRQAKDVDQEERKVITAKVLHNSYYYKFNCSSTDREAIPCFLRPLQNGSHQSLTIVPGGSLKWAQLYR
jgi:hypothetical protein